MREGSIGLTYNLRHVENDNGRFETDTETSNKTTSDDGTKSSVGAGDHLDYNTNHVDDSTDNDSPLAADPVGDITGNDGTEEGTARQDGGDERGVALAEGLGANALDGLDEDLGTVDTVDVTGIVAEEDTTERGKGAHEVGLPGDGSLNLLDALGSLEGDGGLAGLLHHLGLLALVLLGHDGQIGRWGDESVVFWRVS